MEDAAEGGQTQTDRCMGVLGCCVSRKETRAGMHGTHPQATSMWYIAALRSRNGTLTRAATHLGDESCPYCRCGGLTLQLYIAFVFALTAMHKWYKVSWSAGSLSSTVSRRAWCTV